MEKDLPYELNLSHLLLTENSNDYDEDSLSPDFLAIIEYAHYICLCLTVFGFLLNIYVFIRLITQARGDVDKFVDGSGMPLAAMAVADLLSLLLLFLITVMGMNSRELNHSTRVIYCKTSMFLIHTMTGVSMWCWMVASGLRYLAVYHPFLHMSRWKLGQRVIFGSVVISALMNFWLVIAVDANESRCTESDFLFNNDNLNRTLHAVEIGWSYLTPALLTGAMDARVLLTHPPGTIRKSEAAIRDHTTVYFNVAEFDVDHNKNLTDSTCALKLLSTPRPPFRRTQAAVARTAVGHWLLITSIDVLLNAPDTVVRLLTLAGLLCEDCAIQWNPLESYFTFSILIISRLLYFAQFSFNAVFLTAVIYRQKNVRRPAPSTSTFNFQERKISTQSTDC